MHQAGHVGGGEHFGARLLVVGNAIVSHHAGYRFFGHGKQPAKAATCFGAFEFDLSAVVPAATADTIPPMVTINSAVATTTTSLTISASATDNVGVTGMQLYIGGVLKTSSMTGQVSYAWNTPTPGSYELRITADDAAQNTGSATATLTIQ